MSVGRVGTGKGAGEFPVGRDQLDGRMSPERRQALGLIGGWQMDNSEIRGEPLAGIGPGYDPPARAGPEGRGYVAVSRLLGVVAGESHDEL